MITHLTETGLYAGRVLCGRADGKKAHAGYTHHDSIGGVKCLTNVCPHCAAIWDGCLKSEEEYQTVLDRHHISRQPKQPVYPTCTCGETMLPCSNRTNRKEVHDYYLCTACGRTEARNRDNRADVFRTQQVLQMPIEEGLFAEGI